MSPRFFLPGILTVLLALTGCVTQKPCDYTAFRAHPPRSIVVLPPLNESTDIKGTYGYNSTVTRPIAEMGFYVFPVAEVDQLMKENGLPTAGEMHQVPLKKIGE
ncbi:MAG: GNA1162 family protein, partial [Opitutaceae bacterium]